MVGGGFEQAIESACTKAEDWYLRLPTFRDRVNLGSVVGFRHPAIVSEQDCVMHFARFLSDAGVDWESIHHQVSVSRWLFDSPHPAATAGAKRWSVDLALLDAVEFGDADLPATKSGFAFDAFLEFAYLGDSWMEEGATKWGNPEKGRKKVAGDIEKVGRYLESGACRRGYVVVFEECPYGFAPEVEAENGCRVRFIRGYEP